MSMDKDEALCAYFTGNPQVVSLMDYLVRFQGMSKEEAREIAKAWEQQDSQLSSRSPVPAVEDSSPPKRRFPMSFVRDLKIAVGLVVAILAAVGGWSTIVLFQLASGSMTLADVSDGVVWLRQSWDAVGTWTARACAGGAVLRYALPALWRMALTKLTNSIRNIALDVMTTPNTPKQG